MNDKLYEPYKGMREFPPKEHRQLQCILDGWTGAARSYGFSQYKTPVLDPIELYEDKTSQEIMQDQVYSFTDRGDRKVLLRPEITPGVARMVAELQHHRELQKPFKIFSIGSVFRYEREQKGRKREHIQFNVDIFGEKELWADAEVIELLFASLTRIGFNKKDFVVRINDRTAIEHALETAGVKKESLREVLRLLDKRGKKSKDAFKQELKTHTDCSMQDLDTALQKEPKSVKELITLLDGIDAQYDPSIVRGFDYYTGIIFEVYAKNGDVKRSIAGGGRYDNLIETYSGTPLPAVGFGMGDVGLLETMKAIPCEEGRLPSSLLVVFATEQGQLTNALSCANKVRKTANTPDKDPESWDFSVFFAGLVNEKKLGDFYKQTEERWQGYWGEILTLHIQEDGSCVLRNLANREEHTLITPEEVIIHIKKYYEGNRI